MKEVISYINSILCQLFTDEKVHGLVDIVKSKSDSSYYPTQYYNNEYVKIEAGIYHRIISPFKQSLDPDSSCSDQLYLTQYPMRLVAIVDKKGYDEYGDIKVSNLLSSKINFRNNKTLSTLIRADSVYTEITKINNSREEVFKSEFSGLNFVPYNKTLIAIDYTIFINANSNCISACNP